MPGGFRENTRVKSMRLILEIISGPKTGQRIEARAGQVVHIGRTTSADVPIGDSFMSGRHFAVECKGNACSVRDLGSRNGTQVNGEKVPSAVLREGDKIHAGQTDFVVHVETGDSSLDRLPPSQLNVTMPPTGPLGVAVEPKPATKGLGPSDAGKTKLAVESGGAPVEGASKPSHAAQSPQAPKVAAPRKQAVPEALPREKKAPALVEQEEALRSYEAATPEGTLLRVLENQSGSLMALVDAARDRRVLDLLYSSGEEYQSLYRDNQNLALAPHLVRLPRSSPLLKQMTQEGWGHGWGIYLTCAAPLRDLRDYFRQALMVTTPDGVELFSRFYDPRFFRGLLENCSATEAEKFFGPISSYLMEADRPEILLQFKKSPGGVEKTGHLLTLLE